MGLVSKIYKELIQLKNKLNNLIKSAPKKLTITLVKENK